MTKNSYEALSYLVKRELDTKQLEQLIEELKQVIFVRENIPF